MAKTCQGVPPHMRVAGQGMTGGGGKGMTGGGGQGMTGVKGKGMAGARRHRKVLRPENKISKASIRRLARRGGVKRISAGVYATTREVLKEFVEKVLADAIIYTQYAKRMTVFPMDIVYALKKQGRTLYGFGGP